jgi:hypothetical protein
MLATETKTKERVEILVGIATSLDNVPSIEIPNGSVEDTTTFLLQLFKGNHEQQPNQIRSI